MTNPNNAIGTNGAFSGRTSPNALNDILGAFSKGIVSGWTCSPKTGMTVQLGGSASTRDVALAEDNAGNKLTIDNRSGAPVEVTLGGAPSTNNRIGKCCKCSEKSDRCIQQICWSKCRSRQITWKSDV